MGQAQFKFRKNDQIGAAAAEEDEYLSRCFVDTGDLALLEDASDHRFIVLGRTGSGKTALLSQLLERHSKYAINISPENLALTYVSNSTILSFFAELGVNLDPFFKLLWRHIFVVEVLKRYFENHPGHEPKGLFERLRRMFSGTTRKDREMKQAVDYLEKWGRSFWQQTEFRVKEITQKVERDLDDQVSLHLGVPVVDFKSSSGRLQKLTNEETAELRARGQDVISSAQVQDLHRVLRLLDSVLPDRQTPYFVVIDKLDENWVEEKIRYKLIMALIVAARDFFSTIANAKVILAVRRDLVDRVFRLVRESGFQEEKYHSLYLTLAWEKPQLVEILDRRVNALVRRRYTKQRVTHKDLLPAQVRKTDITKYLSERTRRPRDIIAFFNECIAAARNLSRLKAKQFGEAENSYSRSRLRALGDEWSADYPALLDFTKLLRTQPLSFKVSSIEDRRVEDLCLDVAGEEPGGRGILQREAMKVADCVVSAADFKLFLMHVFYKLGLVGLKVERQDSAIWASETGRGVSVGDLDHETSVIVHPMYHRALGIKPS